MKNEIRKRKSGIPTGHAGEYLVMGELLRRGFDAQLADRNTKGYDLLAGSPGKMHLRKVQVKTVRSQPWYVRIKDFQDKRLLGRITVYVLLGREDGGKPVRFFIVKNRKLVDHVSKVKNWRSNAFMNIKWLKRYEGKWNSLR